MSNFWQGFDDVRPEKNVRGLQPRIIIDVNDLDGQPKPLITRTLTPPIKWENTQLQNAQYTNLPIQNAITDPTSVISNKWFIFGAIALVGYLIYSNSLAPADRTVTSVTRYGRR